jgi:hypothetical protein
MSDYETMCDICGHADGTHSHSCKLICKEMGIERKQVPWKRQPRGQMSTGDLALALVLDQMRRRER